MLRAAVLALAVPPGASVWDVEHAAAAGRGFSLIVSPLAREVVGMGANLYGQLGTAAEDGQDVKVPTTVVFPNGDRDEIIDIAAGAFHSLFVTRSGACFAAGRNHYGQLGDGSNELRRTPVRILEGEEVASVSAGYAHSLFHMQDGTVKVAGFNHHGQLGLGHLEPVEVPEVVPNLPSVRGVVAGYDFSYFLTTDGDVYAAGQNLAGQLGDGTSRPRSSVVRVDIEGPVEEVAAGDVHGLFVTRSGGVKATGSNFDGQLGDWLPSQVNRPTLVGNIPEDITGVSAGGDSSCFRQGDGTLLGLGSNRDRQLGLGNDLETTKGVAPEDLVIAPDTAFRETSVGDSHSLFITTGDVKVFGAGSNRYFQLGENVGGRAPYPVNVYEKTTTKSTTTKINTGGDGGDDDDDTTLEEDANDTTGSENDGPRWALDATTVWFSLIGGAGILLGCAMVGRYFEEDPPSSSSRSGVELPDIVHLSPDQAQQQGEVHDVYT